MTESARGGQFSTAGSVDDSAEQRVGEWDGDHERGRTTVAAGFLEETGDLGIDPAELDDEDVFRELQSLHRTRLDTLRHAADSALANHLRRTAELETEYLSRHPGREVEASRLRHGD